MEKESYIEKVFNSTDGMTKAMPNSDLFSKIQMRLQLENRFSTRTLWLVAASIVVLATINISVILKNNNSPDYKVESALAASIDKSNQLY